MNDLLVGTARMPPGRLVEAARGDAAAALDAAARARIAASRAVVLRHAAGDRPVYGVNTGLGGNVGFRLAPAEIAAFQEQLVRGRGVAVGEPLPREVCRAALLARAHGLALGGAGAAPEVVDLLLAMFNAGVTPAIPRHGSIGAGDLVQCAALGAVVIGRGEAWLGDHLLPGAEALARAGLAPLALGPKDGLALINSSAVTVALACTTLVDLGRWLDLAAAAAALAFEGYGANPSIFDRRLAAARPARGQVAAAALFRRLLAGSAINEPGAARAIQDAISFRCLSQNHGALTAAFETAWADVETELNGVADNAMVLVEDGEMLSSGNFHTPVIALACDTLAIAIASHAAASAQRIVKLMTPALSALPKYLSPVGGASCGFVPMQKTVAALLGRIRHLANPASLDAIPVSDTVEDHAPQTPFTITRLAEQADCLAWLVCIEALVAAQAVELRGLARLGEGTRPLYDAVRDVAPPLAEDRETGLDVHAVRERLAAGT